MPASSSSSVLLITSPSEAPDPPVTNSSGVLSVPEGCVTTEFFPVVPWKNKDNLVPKEVDNIVKLVFPGICLALLFIVSFVTNILSMVVFYKHGLKERINACLFTLSLVDLLSIAMSYGLNTDVVYMFVIGKGGEPGPSARFFFRHYLMGLYGLVTSSQIVYTLIAFERCLCITRPLLAKSFMPTKTTVAVLWAVVVVVTGGYVFVCGVRYGVVCVYNARDDTVSYVTYPKDLYFRHQFILDVVYGYVYGLFFPGLSLVSVTACTAITAVKVKQLSQWRETVSSASSAVSSRDLAIFRTIFGNSLLFIVCMVPTVLMRCSFLLVPELKIGGRYDNLIWVIIRIVTMSSAINSTFNFFIYYAYGSKFRETTRRLFSFCYCDKSTSDDTVVPGKNIEKQ